MPIIGTLNESPLHASLKALYTRPGDEVEVPTEGFVADIRNDTSIIEIQTSSFSSMRKKFDTLLDRYQIHLVHPIAVGKWIVKLDADDMQISRRKSPKKGQLSEICNELASFPMLLSHPNFSLDVVLTEEDEVRSPNAKKRRRRGGLAVDHRRLIRIVDTVCFNKHTDLLQILPDSLPLEFNTKDLGVALGVPRHHAQTVVYCLKTAEVITQVDRDSNGIRYQAV